MFCRCTLPVAIAYAICSLTVSSLVWGQDGPDAAQQTTAPVSRTDSVETKLQLLQSAWQQQDYELARSLTASIRDSIIQTQNEAKPIQTSLVPADSFGLVEQLDGNWRRWASGWKYFKLIQIEEPIDIARANEPVEISLSFPSDQVSSLARELRVATIQDGEIVELPSQVYDEVRRGSLRACKLMFQADFHPGQQRLYWILYGSPNAELPEYPTDMEVRGEGYGLDIGNAHYTASLSRQTGQLERLTLRREHGLELFSGGQGHGEPPGIDWAHDYVDEGSFQKLRISLWEKCPDYEIIRGPLCTIVRRWGFPQSPVHPIFTPSRLHVTVEYRFYAGLPWFHKIGQMRAIQNFRAEALRDEEWVFSGQSFTDMLWMDADGKLHTGEVPEKNQEQLWGVGFYHKVSKDCFLALYLNHSSEGIPELKHSGAPMMFYRWHGQVWSRYPLPVKELPAGATLYQKNAYLTAPFYEEQTKSEIEQLRRAMLSPLTIKAVSPNNATSATLHLHGQQKVASSERTLARPGETNAASIVKRRLWEALKDCKDAQLYTADIDVVDLGLIYDLRVRGSVVTVVMTMPHGGRSKLGYFIDGSISVHPTQSVPIRERLLQVPGIKQVVFQQRQSPQWNSNCLTDLGRQKLGLSPQP